MIPRGEKLVSGVDLKSGPFSQDSDTVGVRGAQLRQLAAAEKLRLPLRRSQARSASSAVAIASGSGVIPHFCAKLPSAQPCFSGSLPDTMGCPDYLLCGTQ
ncbi:hypothetical protein KL921_002149 [Ogataea angusta]|uniref:Uncharacterized protein n=1 Tax=Pichia angusta TaxID=870730 RepID=A0ABQ7RZY9_PICAN|nr:hypothetical protein KL921_002149 [Ogataea angusta]KAG7824438.1 hypothetical protein KL909_002436 [Ogataea angusta]KAG7840586.1 hypothetical protein KL942_002537 [Ogataea angusta]KAG7848965.1 hypothetical protein KL941_001783 [Ogataea angusta]KAG7850494.1 hypothetical protein KL940_002054 [Ogataea angusta]